MNNIIFKCEFCLVIFDRYDITAILLCTIEHLIAVCPSVSQFIDPGHNQLPHYTIHNHCSNLLAVMAVLSSPIETLYR